MPDEMFVGWDLGGAHLKVACINETGKVIHAHQLPCPLWQGISFLEKALDEAIKELPFLSNKHALTMTGELVDLFSTHQEGVNQLINTFNKKIPEANTWVYAGKSGFVSPRRAAALHQQIASANWLATASMVARRIPQGLFIDIGSTTTDIVPLRQKVLATSFTDNERLKSEELVYTGVVRTSLMALADKVPFNGEWIPLIAEHFATTADIYRLNGELPAEADQMAAADGKGKSMNDSARRLARMIGLDMEAEPLNVWQRTAKYLATVQQDKILTACQRILSRGILDDDAPLIGAGIGRFVIIELARRLNRPYIDFTKLIDADKTFELAATQCAPAVAVATLLKMETA